MSSSTRNSPNSLTSRSSDQGPGPPFRALESSAPDTDWLATLLFNARTMTAGAGVLPFPYVQGVFGTAVFLLETVQKVQRNRDDMKELCSDIVDIITIIRDRISFHRDTAALQFKVQCEELEGFLQDVVEAIHQRQIKPRGFSARFKEVVKSSSTSDEIRRFRDRIRDVRSNFMLMTAVDTNFGVQKVLTEISPNVPVPQVAVLINNCPPPTRIFHGRRAILDKMHQFFIHNVGEQNIFLLHGLGGAGKTQIALKFIHESATHTAETIDTGLKTIATTKGVGNSSQDALEWLKSKQDEWLLFFDNADNPKIDLNNYFPSCTHGNILITSRNPGLSVHAGTHCTVSDMEGPDAVALLLRSAAQVTTDHNKEAAAEIVKALCYLPLAIIQAGAFISKSGNLGGYLAIYAHSKAQLLNQRPAQSHDNYAWTVYTTWQISYDQLSEEARTFLKLCSFLHYQGISEDIFKNAANFRLGHFSPSKEELAMPLRLLAQLLGPAGQWDPLYFMEVTSEIRAYSLINFDSEKNLFSIHPLVHDWTRNTLAGDFHHHCMVVIAGMSLAGISEDDVMLASPWMLPHIDFLMKDLSSGILDFRLEYGKVYLFAGKPQKALEFTLEVLDNRRNRLGEDHPATLDAMYWLAWAYQHLGKWKEAEELGDVVLKKRRDILGDTHQDTLNSMGNLVLVYGGTGKLQEAEELGIALLQKLKTVLDSNHPDILKAMANLVHIYHDLGKLKEAEELGHIVLEKQRCVLGDNHRDTCNSLGNLAAIYHSLGKFSEAEKLQALVFEKERSILGDNHPDTLSAMGNLASMYQKIGRLSDAEKLNLVVVKKRRNVLGENHPTTLQSMGNLAFTYNKLGKLKEAEKLEIMVVERLKQTLGNDHPETLRVMGNLAITCHKLGKLGEAHKLQVAVLEKRRNILGENHPHTLRAMSHLGSTLNRLERWQEAEEFLVQALRKQTELLGDRHPFNIDTMQDLAATYMKLGKLKEAEDLNTTLKRN
ncbi:hypothetical protein FB451DRAFT_1370720 [Mycena latifolia]|nr:hypothetical protein FB451DRAFT_1370720 [Mycena latifolia]